MNGPSPGIVGVVRLSILPPRRSPLKANIMWAICRRSYEILLPLSCATLRLVAVGNFEMALSTTAWMQWYVLN